EPVYLTAQTTGPAVEAGKTTTFEIPLRRAVQVVQEVRDAESNTPVVGVRLTMRSLTDAASGDTDASGRLRVDVLPSVVSPRVIRIPSPYYYPGYLPSAEIAERKDAVTLKVIELARGVPLRGRVVDDNERPLAGAEVVGFWKLPTNWDEAGHVWTNERGEFTLDAVAPQTPVRLWARHGAATSVQPVVAQAGGEPVSLMVGNEAGVSLEGRVLDAEGRPVAAATVRIWARQLQFVGPRNSDLGSVLFDGNDLLLTDADGRFRTPRFLRLNAAYSLEVEAPGMLPCETEAIEPESWHTTRFADVVLHRAPRLRVVHGRVIDRQGRAVAGAAVWQSGDGPRRTRTTTDDEGRFQLGGIYDAAAILFARKDSFRLQGARIAPAEETCQITLRRSDEPAAVMATLPPALPLEEQRELGMSLIEPSLPMLRDPVPDHNHRDFLRTAAHVDPAKALELADGLADGFFPTVGREVAAISLVWSDFEEGLAVMAGLDPPWTAVQACVFACDELIDGPRERRVKLLDVALPHALTEPDPGLRARELGRIAVRWLDLG
ncbi:MAG: hypothetical protein ACREHD_19915, partial [Pirellulales bacterium]